MKNAVNYDLVSQIYDESRIITPETYKILVNCLAINHDSVVLDIGCGTGNYTSAIKRITNNIIGIDQSIGMLQRARRKNYALSLICCDATELPFESETFDAAYSTFVIHHVNNKVAFLNEAYRVLKDNSCFAIESCTHQQMQTFWFYHYFPQGLEIDIARIPDSLEIVTMLDKVGFSDIKIEISYTDIVREYDNPELYLDKNYRDGQSTFQFLAESDIKLGCIKLRQDIESGRIGNIIKDYEARERQAGGSIIISGHKI